MQKEENNEVSKNGLNKYAKLNYDPRIYMNILDISNRVNISNCLSQDPSKTIQQLDLRFSNTLIDNENDNTDDKMGQNKSNSEPNDDKNIQNIVNIGTSMVSDMNTPYIIDNTPLISIEKINEKNELILPKSNINNQTRNYVIIGKSKSLCTQEDNLIQKIQKFIGGKTGKAIEENLNNNIENNEEDNSLDDKFDAPIRYFHKSIDNGCQRCQQIGHFEKDCPQEFIEICIYCCGQHSTQSCNSIVCFRCNGIGHISKECKHNDPKICYRCNKRGHKQNDCNMICMDQKSKLKEINELIKDIRCNVCNKLGHITCHVGLSRGEINFPDDIFSSKRKYQNHLILRKNGRIGYEGKRKINEKNTRRKSANKEIKMNKKLNNHNNKSHEEGRKHDGSIKNNNLRKRRYDEIKYSNNINDDIEELLNDERKYFSRMKGMIDSDSQSDSSSFGELNDVNVEKKRKKYKVLKDLNLNISKKRNGLKHGKRDFSFNSRKKNKKYGLDR